MFAERRICHLESQNITLKSLQSSQKLWGDKAWSDGQFI